MSSFPERIVESMIMFSDDEILMKNAQTSYGVDK
jgi:hypothetical protein